MKLFRICLALTFAATLGLQSCTPDEVKPKNNGTDLQASWEEDAIHNQPGEICGDPVSLNLAMLDGNTLVNYCGSVGTTPLPCNGTMPGWGVGITANVRNQTGEDLVMVDMTMAPSWFVTACVAKVAEPENFNIDMNGVPIVDATWHESAVNPFENRWAMTWNMGPHNGPACTAFAAKVTVVKLNFFSSSPDPMSVRELWIYNPDHTNQATPEMLSPSALITPWCLRPCPGDVVTIDPRTLCEDFPSIPEPSCTQTVSSTENIHINNASSVVCVPVSRNLGSVNFNSAGTLVIGADANVSGGINANNGGTLIVKGNFNWNGNANINGNFKIYIMEGGSLTRSNDLTMNNQNNLLVNLGNLNIGSNLTYNGQVYNGGTLQANGINVNSSNSKLINSGSITSNNFVNINNSTLMENCGSLKVGNNLEMNSGSTVKNFCSIVTNNVTHANGNFQHYGTLVSGLNGSADGFSIQGPTTLHDNATIVTRNFFWSANQPLQLDGNATVLVANATLSNSNEVTSLGGTGRLRMSGGSSLSGEGTLTIADIDPIGSGDNPTAPNVSFPEGLHNLVSKNGGANLVLRALNPQSDIPSLCN